VQSPPGLPNFDRVMELDIRMMGSTKLRYLEWFSSVVESNCVHQTGARYSLTNLETSCGYSSPTTITFLWLCDGMADVVDSKSTGENRGGSSPSIATKLYE
jgi:hypothetical protein